MIRGRKPTPLHVKLVTGNPGKRKLPVGTPDPEPALPHPPPELSNDAKKEWHRISARPYHLKCLSEIDRAALAAYCAAYARWAMAERMLAAMAEDDPTFGGLMIRTNGGNLIQNPLVGIANKAMADTVRFAAEFGMTPSARARLVGIEDIPSDEDAVSRFFTVPRTDPVV